MTIARVRTNLPRPAPLSTTGIGSLPHTQLEIAVQQALAVDIPYLPQLPMKDPAEFMIPQALDGLPGMRPDGDGGAVLDVATWERESSAFDSELEEALSARPRRMRAFDPTAASASAWMPFLWEVEERRLPFAKVQLAGPITARWGLRLSDGRPVAAVPKLDQQVFRLVLARSLAMVRALKERGTTPLFFIDEPGVYALDPRNQPAHALLLEELRILVLALKKEGALVGLHCCANTHWEPVLGLGLDFLSVDSRLSLGPLLATGNPFWKHLDEGGWLALGVVPTNIASTYDLDTLLESELSLVRAHGGDEGLARVLAQTVLTPACGLALRTVPESERTFEDLAEAQRALKGLRPGRLAPAPT